MCETISTSAGAIGKPSRAIGTPKRLSGSHSRRSQQAAISRPPPMHAPSMCAISGTSQSSIACSAGRDDVLVVRRERLGLEAELRELLDVRAGDELAVGAAHHDHARRRVVVLHARRTPRAARATSPGSARSSCPGWRCAAWRCRPRRPARGGCGRRTWRAPAWRKDASAVLVDHDLRRRRIAVDEDRVDAAAGERLVDLAASGRAADRRAAAWPCRWNGRDRGVGRRGAERDAAADLLAAGVDGRRRAARRRSRR